MALAAQRVFLSYNFADEAFVERLARHLLTQRPGLETYFYRFDGEAGPWSPQIKRALKKANCCVAIVGAQVGDVQRRELNASIKKRRRIVVSLPSRGDSSKHRFFAGLDPVRVRDVDDRSAFECAQAILQYLKHPWTPVDGVPQG